MEQNSIWIIGAVALAVGGLIGYLLGRSGSDAGQRQTLNNQLDEAKAELATYKQEVTDHFEKTATLVNQLTNTYKDVHQHLASGAQTLCDDDAASLALNESMQAKLTAAPEAPIPVVTDVVPNVEAEKVPEPPRDYAAKSSNEKGTLSEAYGLESEGDEDERLTDPAHLAALKAKEKEKGKEPASKGEKTQDNPKAKTADAND
ncbi:YhcB family protein [Marinobacterium sedimentorum]|uniref:YhcB family protein n=1 Tax=Marinobacterium sedimentorum TaxID=2927804 RepID=UPI0020C6FFA3|nr:YhcB family protein [Marinobacterium sedimentorum]